MNCETNPSLSLETVLARVKGILQLSPELVAQNRVNSEAEQLVVASFRKATGTQLSRLEFFSNLGQPFPKEQLDEVIELAHSRVQGRPLQHLIGYQVFFDHEYEVGPDVLVPRPETEILLTSAIAELNLMERPPSLGFEVGIGSGILSIELLCQYPSLRMVASDLSDEALLRARHNADRILGPIPNALDRLMLTKANHSKEVWEPFRRQFQERRADFLIMNPPYLIPSDEIDLDVLRHEPHHALFAPVDDPLFFYRKVIEGADDFIGASGMICAELPHERAQAIGDLFNCSIWEARVLPDLNQRDRVLIAHRRAQAKGQNA